MLLAGFPRAVAYGFGSNAVGSLGVWVGAGPEVGLDPVVGQVREVAHDAGCLQERRVIREAVWLRLVPVRPPRR